MPSARTVALDDGELRLRDGRKLVYAQYGRPDGLPFLYCHGFPGSRLEPHFSAAAASRHGLRLISVDRPGFGGSDFQPRRRVLDFPPDALELMRHLAIRRFGVVAASGGAPYALACGYALPEHVTRLGIVCGVGPGAPAHDRRVPSMERVVLALARKVPGAARLLCAAAGTAVRHAPGVILRMLGASSPDTRLLAHHRVRDALVASMREAFRAGSRGVARDLLLLTHPWGFRPEEVSVKVHLWHGELDRVVPASATRRFERMLPRCSARYYPTEGHYSIVLNHLDDILRELADHAGSGS